MGEGEELCREVAEFGKSWRSQKSMDIGGCHGAITPLTDHMECTLCPLFIFRHILLSLLAFAIKDSMMFKANNNRSLGVLLCNPAIHISAFILGIK